MSSKRKAFATLRQRMTESWSKMGLEIRLGVIALLLTAIGLVVGVGALVQDRVSFLRTCRFRIGSSVYRGECYPLGYLVKLGTAGAHAQHTQHTRDPLPGADVEDRLSNEQWTSTDPVHIAQ